MRCWDARRCLAPLRQWAHRTRNVRCLLPDRRYLGRLADRPKKNPVRPQDQESTRQFVAAQGRKKSLNHCTPDRPRQILGDDFPDFQPSDHERAVVDFDPLPIVSGIGTWGSSHLRDQNRASFASIGPIYQRNARRRFLVPIPRAWPSRVKSAILHVISLAQFSLAYTRGWAANSPNSRIRLKAELDRALQEITLLREEMRIKDVRMAQISPHRRPYYPSTAACAPEWSTRTNGVQ